MLTVADIDDRLVGLDQWRAAAAKSNSRYDNAKILSNIPGWIREFERKTQIRINPVQVTSAPDGAYGAVEAKTGTISAQGKLVTGIGTSFESLEPGNQIVVGSASLAIVSIQDDLHLTLERNAPPWSGATFGVLPYPTIHEPGYPYYVSDGSEFFVTTFRQRPVREVQRLRLMFNGSVKIFEPPASWFSLDGQSGRFWMLPVYGSAIIQNASAAAVAASITFWDHIPNFLFFDYIAGLPEGWEYSTEWSDLSLQLSGYCALKVLEDISQAIGAGSTGKQTQGVGISQNLNYTRFQDRKTELTDAFTAYAEILVAQESPLMMSVV